jgi:two-component system cell cycle response regulator
LSGFNFFIAYDVYNFAINVKKEFSKTEKKIARLKDTAEKDHLTGAHNRMTFDKYLDEIYKESKINNEPFFVVFFDIDHFKKFNDTYGHESGDKVLKVFAQTINKNIRKDSDVFFRYGGEEFVLVSSNHIRNSMQEARFLTKKLKDAVEKIRIPNLPKITCSMGVGFFDGNKSKEEILKEADNNVYLAKENGRNRTYITKDIVVV